MSIGHFCCIDRALFGRQLRARTKRPCFLAGLFLYNIGLFCCVDRALLRRQLRDDLMTMLIAGHETTAAVLTWTMYLLATHPEEAEKARAEVRSS